ncbi:MAG TPA: hypothetical protein VM677_32045 [Actinokineospora sp.]|jgi:hypothetical protein|nr:hypothetical protein [Actinokineospora sp.]
MRYGFALIVALMLALTGCSTSYDPNAPMADVAEVRADEVEDWVDKVCAVMIDAGGPLRTKPAAASADLAATKTNLVTYLTKGSEALGAAVKRFDEIGDGPAPGSKRLVKDLKAAVGELKAAIDAAIGTAQSADPADPAKFAETVMKAGTDLEAAVKAADLDVKMRAEFVDAQKKAPNCQKLDSLK